MTTLGTVYHSTDQFLSRGRKGAKMIYSGGGESGPRYMKSLRSPFTLTRIPPTAILRNMELDGLCSLWPRITSLNNTIV